MEQDNKIVLGYWKIRGLGFQVRTVLEYLGVPYTAKEYEQGDAPEYSRQTWLDEKFSLGLPFPNLPYLIDGDAKLTETLAIIIYLANKYDKTLLGKTDTDFGIVQMLLHLLHDLKGSMTGPCYSQTDKAVPAANLDARLPPILAYLGEKPYFVGDYITIADLYLLETLDYAAFVTDGAVFTKYPQTKAFFDRITAVPRIQEWRSSDRFYAGPFNNKIARINN